MERLRKRQATVAIIGLGYVGLPLACEFARTGLTVLGIDTDRGKIDGIGRGHSHVQDVPDGLLRDFVKGGRLTATGDFSVLARADAVVICVPTPLRKTRDPDISYIVAAVEQIARYLHPGMLIVLESTTYPGTTEEVMLPKLQASGLRVGHDFFLAFSPERVDPGNPRFTTRNTPKIVGGATVDCVRVARALYDQAIETVIPVSSTRTAEMVKLLENTFRSVNIGLVNEVALMCDRLGLDVWEVIDAAATKPFGFMRFYPGPGLGGHCIPIDPHYLSWKLKTLNYSARFIELASEINGNMPQYVVTKTVDALNDQRKSARGARVLVLGVAYKKDVGDVRESPALDVIKLLADRGAEIRYNDPYAAEIAIDGGQRYRSVPLTEAELRAADIVLIVTDHTTYDYGFIVEHASCVLDTRNATRSVTAGRDKLRRL
ncbi:MAG TPA: nucleotide sugar dehydrogenase [Candidatus Polarisedimenticolia bacterium]|nr:nucleotide sugar dehydrogenase [Candidatus Polarisedimenticolia bacterium]